MRPSSATLDQRYDAGADTGPTTDGHRTAHMLTIRREEPDDAEAIARVHMHGWQAGYAGIMPDEVLGG